MRGGLVTESGEIQVYERSEQRGGVWCFFSLNSHAKDINEEIHSSPLLLYAYTNNSIDSIEKEFSSRW